MQDKVKGTQQASKKYFFTYSEYTRNIKKKKKQIIGKRLEVQACKSQKNEKGQ